MKYVWLIGDYLNSPERQRNAKQLGCNLVFDFHFNSNGPTAKGAEVWRKPGDQKSLEVARAILQGYKDLGLPIHGEGIKEAVKGTRPSWIRHYEMPAVELEPLFVTNPNEARWVHNEANLDSMAAMFAKVAETQLRPDATVGLSIGHLFKSPTSTDKGARCVLGDYEADHASALAHKIANLITGENDAATHHENDNTPD